MGAIPYKGTFIDFYNELKFLISDSERIIIGAGNIKHIDTFENIDKKV